MALGNGPSNCSRGTPHRPRIEGSVMIFGSRQCSLPTLVRRDVAAETVVAARSGVAAIDGDGHGDWASD